MHNDAIAIIGGSGLYDLDGRPDVAVLHTTGAEDSGSVFLNAGWSATVEHSARIPFAVLNLPRPATLRLIRLPDLSVAEYDLTGEVAGRSFTWSSDGSQIIFTDALSQRLFAFDIAGEEFRQISGEHTIRRWWTGAGAALP